MEPSIFDAAEDEPLSETKSSGNSSTDAPPEAIADEFVPFAHGKYEPDTLAETTRKSGLAWSAGIVFFSSIAFTMILGWFADLLLGSSPWGIVGGIILGSVIGFIQFFRITSKIFPHPKSETPPRTLISNDSDEK